jgi:hypothetical protein
VYHIEELTGSETCNDSNYWICLSGNYSITVTDVRQFYTSYKLECLVPSSYSIICTNAMNYITLHYINYITLHYIDFINNDSFCRTRTFEVTSHLDFSEESWEGAVDVQTSYVREAASHIVP